MEILEKLGLLLLGWLLGLLGPAIVDHIRRTRENVLGRKAILTELHEVGGVLAIAVHGVRVSECTVDREHLQWLKTYLEQGVRSEKFKKMAENIGTYLSWTDDEISLNFAAMQKREGRGTMLQKYPVPLLDSRVSALWSFDTVFQRNLLEIRQRIHRLDDLVDRQRKMHDMTFSNLENANRAAVYRNIDETCAFYAQSARTVVDLVASITDNKI